MVEADSHVACAIMARRCLEMTLKHLKFEGKNLYARVEAASADPRASHKLKEQLHRLRDSGNYAVHGDLIGDLAAYEVGAHEVEAAFDALDDLFEDFFVAPAKLAARKALFEAKEQKAVAAKAEATGGKPPPSVLGG